LSGGRHSACHVPEFPAQLQPAEPADVLIAKDGAVIAKTTYREWLAR
jgi:hypothetical protein